MIGGGRRYADADPRGSHVEYERLHRGLVVDLEQKLEDAREDLANLAAAAREYAVAMGPSCDPGCPADDTCDCEGGKIGKSLSAALAAAGGR